jgi:hypothetical protein
VKVIFCDVKVLREGDRICYSHIEETPMSINQPFDYFISTISSLDDSFVHLENKYETLKHYMNKLNEISIVQNPISHIHIQDQYTAQHFKITQPIDEILSESYLLKYQYNQSLDIRFAIVFSDDESDYSSHVSIVGMLSPQFTYQVMIQRLKPSEENILFTLQLALYTMWQATQEGTYPWVSLLEC